MSDHVYKIIELTGTSKKSVEDAVQTAVGRASATLRNMRWFEVTNVRGEIKDDRVEYWQVTLKIGFTLKDAAGD